MDINNLLKVEKIGKQLLRGGIALYLASIVFFSLSNMGTEGFVGLQIGLLALVLIFIIFMLLFHYKKPKAGAIGGIGSILFFLASGLFTNYNDYMTDIPGSIIFLNVIKDILLAFGSLVLTGESVKEMVRARITKPFPIR
jgi:uncharacterized membrane protein YkgB